MLSIIICSISPSQVQEISKNIEETIGNEYELLAFDNREKKWPIAKVYNEQAKRAKYPYLFFVHEDVRFHSKDWGTFIEAKLQEENCGVIGFAGSKIKFNFYSGWSQLPPFACARYYQGFSNGEKVLEVHNGGKEVDFEEVVTVDGLGMLVRTDVWKEYPFDEKVLTGFHCYDLDFSLALAASKKYKNYVCMSPQMMVEHMSEGCFGHQWLQATIKIHRKKWKKLLPLYTSDTNLSKKAFRHHEEIAFNFWLKEIRKINRKTGRKVFFRCLVEFPHLSKRHLYYCIRKNFGSYYY